MYRGDGDREQKSNSVENEGMEDWMDKNDYDLLCFWENVMCKRAKMFKLCSVRSFLTKVFTIVRIFVPNSHSHLFNKLAYYLCTHILTFMYYSYIHTLYL